MRVYSAVHCCLRAWAWARARVCGGGASVDLTGADRDAGGNNPLYPPIRCKSSFIAH